MSLDPAMGHPTLLLKAPNLIHHAKRGHEPAHFLRIHLNMHHISLFTSLIDCSTPLETLASNSAVLESIAWDAFPARRMLWLRVFSFSHSDSWRRLLK